VPAGEAVLTDAAELFTAWPAEPKPSDSPLDSFGAALSGYTLYFAQPQALASGSKLQVRGLEHYVVSGAEWHWPSSGVAGYVVQVARLNLPQTAVRQRATTGTDARNNQQASWATPSEVTYACLVYAPTTSEIRDNGDRVEVDLQVVLPPDADVTAKDRLVIDGTTYDVIGQPLKQYAPVAHLRASVRWVSNG
jgi:hypothetical protein